MRCTVCKHPKSRDIDLAILSGNYTLSELKQLFGPSRSAFHRHQKHLQQKISRAEAQLENTVRMAHLFKLNSLLDEASDTIKTAREEGNSRLRLQAVNTSARLVQAMDKMAAPLDQTTVYRLMTSPQGPQSHCFLPVDSHILAENFQALALSFKFPCPEAEPRELTDPEDREDQLQNGEGAASDSPDAKGEDDLAAAPPSAPRLSPQETRDLGDFLAQAGLLPDPPPVAETQARHQRHKSGTEAGQNAPLVKESSEIQPVKQDVKKSETTPAAPRKTANGKRQTAKDPLRRKLPQPPAPVAPHSCNSDQLYEHYLREKAAALAAVAPSPVSDGPQAPPPVPPAAGLEPSLEAAPQTPDAAPPEPGAAAPKPKDRFAGYFKFPGDYPPGYLHAVTHGYWPDDPPKHIPDRRWEEDFLPANRFGKTKGTY